MMSNYRPEERQNPHDNVFDGLHVGTEEPSLVTGYLAGHDFADHTRKAIKKRPAEVCPLVQPGQSRTVCGEKGHAAGCD
jgi:hypothetical protein